MYLTFDEVPSPNALWYLFSFLVKTCILVAYSIFKLSKHVVITGLKLHVPSLRMGLAIKVQIWPRSRLQKLDDELNEAFDEIIKSTTIHLKTFVWLRRHWAWVFWCCSLTFLCHKKVFLLLCSMYSNPNLNSLHLNPNLGQILGFGNF